MNEFIIMKYLNDLKLNNILCIIKSTYKQKNAIDEYTFQAKKNSNEFVMGKIIIYSNKINIIYKINEQIHLFSSEKKYYNPQEYSILTKHSLLRKNNEEEILEEKTGENISTNDFFCFQNDKNSTQKKKILVSY